MSDPTPEFVSLVEQTIQNMLDKNLIEVVENPMTTRTRKRKRMAEPRKNGYSIYCKVCGDDVDLIKDGLDDFHCTVCNTYYTSENGVMDWAYAYDMWLLYKGAKIAGLIDEPDVPREQYHSEWRD